MSSSAHQNSWMGTERLRVQSEIEGHYDQIHKLKEYLNTLTPIGKLPPELMAKIFLIIMKSQNFCRTSSAPWEIPDHGGYSASWFVVACVCRRWRDIAMQTGTLWTAIKPARREWTELLLERSKSSPLSLLATSLNQVNSRAFDVTLQNMSRFSSIDMEGNSSRSRYAVERQSLPLLRHIIFTSSVLVDHRGRRRSITMPDMFNRCLLPALESLILSGFVLNPTSPMFARTLTNLTISRAVHLTVPVLIEILAKTPALSRLSLHNDYSAPTAGFFLYPAAPTDLRTITLAHLEYFLLALEGNPEDMISLLNHLSFPALAHFSITSRLPDSYDIEELRQGLMPTLSRENRIGPAPKYRTCVVDFDRAFFHLWHEFYPAQHEKAIDGGDAITDVGATKDGFSFRVASNTDLSAPSRSISTFLGVLHGCPLEGIESVFITVERRADLPLGWHSVFSMMPNVSSLQLHASDREGKPVHPSYFRLLLSKLLLLSADRDSDAEGETGSLGATSVRHPPFPNLRIFVLSGMLLNAKLVDALTDVLTRRKARRAAIETLVIQGCPVREEDLERLRRAEVVGDVTQTWS